MQGKESKTESKKLRLKTKQVEYIGHVLTENGLQPDPKEVDAVINFPAPVDKQELQRFLGMINYLGKFVPNMSKLNEPLRRLLEKDVEFNWDCA